MYPKNAFEEISCVIAAAISLQRSAFSKKKRKRECPGSLLMARLMSCANYAFPTDDLLLTAEHLTEIFLCYVPCGLAGGSLK